MNAPKPHWRIDLPIERRRAMLASDLGKWIEQDCLKELAGAFGEVAPEKVGSGELYEFYARISEAHWDLRRGVERNLAAAGTFSSQQRAAVGAAADCLGLANASFPSRPSYDYLVILGGLVRACITRPRYASMLTSSRVRAGQTLALGGFRALGGNEIELASALGISAENEFTAMIEGVKLAYPGVGEVTVETSARDSPKNDDYAIARFTRGDVLVVAAPSRDPERRRANTADTFAWWAAREDGWRGRRILIVTNPIYVPYQSAAALETLAIPFDADVEVVGVDAQASDLGEHTQTFTAANYIQEVRSTIMGYRSLLNAVTRHG